MADTPRVRFAPSPTGSLHIGSARTALFNYLYAKSTGGTYILRIEDTDEARSTDESLVTIIDGLRWLGLNWDEGPGALASEGKTGSVGEYGPYLQSQRKDRHDLYAQRLLDSGHAHWVDAEYNSHGLDKQEGDALAFRTPDDGETVVYDKIKGEVRFQNKDLGDFVIVKANGTALYNFAVVCDDLDMKVSLVLRGDDHLSNTPKQLLLYKALGEKPPAFGHIPLILDEEGAKISKRKQYQWATNIEWYREQGFLPEAFINYLVRLCWSDGTDNEFWTLEQLERKFSLKGVNPTPARFDFVKLKWFNGKYIRELYKHDAKHYWYLCKEHLCNAGLLGAQCPDDLSDRARKIANLLHDRLEYFAQIGELSRFFFEAPADYPEEERTKAKVTAETATLLREVAIDLGGVDPWDIATLDKQLRSFAEEKGVKFGDIVHPLRLAVTGSTASPGIFEVLELLGKEETLTRVEALATVLAS